MGKHKNQGFSRSDYLKHPGQFAKPLTGKNFKRELKSMRKLEFGPQMRELKQEKRASNLQQQRIGDWFNQYQQQVGRLNTNVTGAYNQAVQGAQQDTNATSAYAEKLRQRVANQAQASAALRGAPVSTAADQQAVQANIARRQSADSTTGLIRAQGANQHAYFADKKRIGKGEEISQLLQEAARGRQTNQDIKNLNQQKQDFTDKFLHDSRAQEQNFYLGLLQAQLGNKQAKLSANTSRANAKLSAHQSNIDSIRSAQQSNRNSQRSARTSRRNSRRSNSNQGHANQHDRQRAIQHMYQELKGNPPPNKANNAAILNHLLHMSSSYSRSEAKRALKKYLKHKGHGGSGVGPGPGHTHR